MPKSTSKKLSTSSAPKVSSLESGAQHRWLAALVGAAFFVSLALNGLLLTARNSVTRFETAVPHSSQDLSDASEHAAVKHISTMGDFTWIGRVKEDVGGENLTHYELVQRDADGNETVIEAFPHGPCDDAQWSHKSDGRFTFNYSSSPCEAFTVSTEIAFDEHGTEVLRSHSRSDAGTITFQQPNRPEYTLTLLTSETCIGKSFTTQNGKVTWPETTLLGVTVTSSEGSFTSHLPQAKTISCGAGYGDTVLDPFISNVSTDSYGITFELPDGTQTYLSFDSRSREVKVNFY